ncbi:MAG: hypothetical protein ACI8QZ_003455 [Chlamydiales bacterium]|jgi:hypothetical protein
MNRPRWWLLPAVFVGGWWLARILPGTDGALPVAAGTAQVPHEEQEPSGKAALSAEIRRLRGVLLAEREGRAEREVEWLEFTRAMASLDVEEAPPTPSFLAFDLPASTVADGASEASAEPDPGAERALVILRDLSALLLGEHVMDMDILEIGRVADGATGPVVVRLLDDRGRPTGILACERLRLECSRAARSVTLVFEDGYERYGDQVLTFGVPDALVDAAADATSVRRAGVRRIELPHVDPKPWIDRLPELFDPEDVAALPDDGRWDRELVRGELNRLLDASARGGRWRLRELGGVVGEALRVVHLVQLDPEGRTIQRIFADELRIEAEGSGILLMMRDGVSEREGRRAPFLDGRYRIFLPAAPMADWGAARLPHSLPAGGDSSAPQPEAEPRAGQ